MGFGARVSRFGIWREHTDIVFLKSWMDPVDRSDRDGQVAPHPGADERKSLDLWKRMLSRSSKKRMQM